MGMFINDEHTRHGVRVIRQGVRHPGESGVLRDGLERWAVGWRLEEATQGLVGIERDEVG